MRFGSSICAESHMPSVQQQPVELVMQLERAVVQQTILSPYPAERVPSPSNYAVFWFLGSSFYVTITPKKHVTVIPTIPTMDYHNHDLWQVPIRKPCMMVLVVEGRGYSTALAKEHYPRRARFPGAAGPLAGAAARLKPSVPWVSWRAGPRSHPQGPKYPNMRYVWLLHWFWQYTLCLGTWTLALILPMYYGDCQSNGPGLTPRGQYAYDLRPDEISRRLLKVAGTRGAAAQLEGRAFEVLLAGSCEIWKR